MKRRSILLSCLLILMMLAIVHSFPVPDTGQTKCYNDSGEIPCPAEGQALYGQDGNYTINPPSYTNLDASGNDLPDAAADQVMVGNNVSGLKRENKGDLI